MLCNVIKILHFPHIHCQKHTATLQRQFSACMPQPLQDIVQVCYVRNQQFLYRFPGSSNDLLNPWTRPFVAVNLSRRHHSTSSHSTHLVFKFCFVFFLSSFQSPAADLESDEHTTEGDLPYVSVPIELIREALQTEM